MVQPTMENINDTQGRPGRKNSLKRDILPHMDHVKLHYDLTGGWSRVDRLIDIRVLDVRGLDVRGWTLGVRTFGVFFTIFGY